MAEKLSARTSEAMNENSRKARKRATDRKAQRDHRLRQKEYLRHLEKTIEELRVERPRDDVICELLEEKSRLQARCHALATRLSRVRSLVMEDDCIAPGSGLQGHETSSDEIHDSDPGNPRLDDPSFHDLTSMIEDGLVQSESGTTPEASLAAIVCRDTNATNEIIIDDSDRVESSILSGLTKDLPMPSTANVPSTPNDILLDLTLFDSIDVPLMTHTLETSTGSLCHPSSFTLQYTDFSPPFPRYCSPTSKSDTAFLEMIIEARREHLQGRFNISQPSLQRLLSGTPTDTLSFRLFNWLRGYGPMPLHLLVAIFWTQYLFLRWHVLQTQESYECVPEFLRPTPIEQVVPHQFFIGMLVWPDIRLCLIKQGTTSDPEGVGIKLLQHLNPSWSTEGAPKSQFTLDILGFIEQQVNTQAFWRIDPGFFVMYPEFRDCGKLA